MVQFRPQGREVIAKVVYYGPPLGGKTTNLRSLYNGYPDDTRGELVVVPAGGDRTIFFDFLSVDAGNLRGMKLRVQLYTVPGQVHYNATRQVVLRGVDAVVFVADSQHEMVRSNRESWENLKDNLLLQGLSLQDMPHVLQYNKRDLPDVLSIDDIDALLNQYNAPFYEAVASTGIGVEETLQGVVKLLVRSLRDRFKLGAEHVHEGAGQPHAAAQHVGAPIAEAPHNQAAEARIFSFGQVQAPSPAAVREPIPVVEPRAAQAGPVLEDQEEPDVTRKVRVPPFGEEAEIPPESGETEFLRESGEAEVPPGSEDPFAWEAPSEVGADDDVFGAVPGEAGKVNAGEVSFARAEVASVGSRPEVKVAPPGLSGFDTPAPLPELSTPLVGDEPYEVAAGSGDRVPESDGVGAQAKLAAVPVAPEEFGFVPLGLIDRLRSPVEPSLAGSLEGRIGEDVRLGDDTPRVEEAQAATEGVAAGSQEPAAEAPAPAEEAPFGEADEVGSETAAQRLFMGAGFVDAAAAGETFSAEDGFSAPAGFEADVSATGSAAAGLDGRPGDAEGASAETGSVGEVGSSAGSEVEGGPAREGENQVVPADQLRAGLGGESGAGAEASLEHDDGWPTEESDEREGASGDGVVDESGDKPPAVVEIPSSAIRRIAPRALAQVGEVRELEIEVPVPAPWTGGKRMTLQLRLTLVPQEEEHGE